jgi:acyl carrier protein
MEVRILSVLRKIFPNVNIDSNVDNLEDWDSINHLRCILSLEEEFNIMFTPEEIMEMDSVKKIMLLINDKIT